MLGHAYPLSGRAEGVVWTASQVAVEGFFVISGYLVVASRMRLGLTAYAWHRALRILPGFYVCLAVVGFGVAPFGARLAGEPWHPIDGLAYVVRNVFVHMRDFGVGATLRSVPFPVSWDDPLWSLWFELIAYAAAGLALSSRFVRRRARTVLPALAVLLPVALVLVVRTVPDPAVALVQGLRLLGFFAAGASLWAWRERIVVTAPALAGAAAVEAIAYLGDPLVREALTPFVLGYLLLGLGSSRRVTVGSRTDLSYGIYIYGWPAQQVLMVVGLARWSPPAIFLATLALVVPLAWLSWHLVERPALGLKHRGPGRASYRVGTGPGLSGTVETSRSVIAATASSI